MSVPQVSGVCPPNDLETFESQQVASDCLWSDPAKGDQARHDRKVFQGVELMLASGMCCC